MDEQIQAGMAKLNITWHGANGDLPDLVAYDSTDAMLKQMAEESVRGGYVPGIQTDAGVDLADFVVDRFPATGDVVYNRIFIRPKTPFGA